MTADILAIIIATSIQVLVSVIGLGLLGWHLSRMLREITAQTSQITAEVTFDVLQGRRMDEVLREMRESLREMQKSPAR